MARQIVGKKVTDMIGNLISLLVVLFFISFAIFISYKLGIVISWIN